MTSGSRSGCLSGLARTLSSGKHRVWSGWHKLCIHWLTMTVSTTSLTACYLGDIVLVDQNDAPQIVESTTAESVLVVDLALYPVYVAALDDTDDVLTFLWVKAGEPIPDAEQIPMGSLIRLDRDEPGLSGQELRVSVFDSLGASTSQSWTLEVP